MKKTQSTGGNKSTTGVFRLSFFSQWHGKICHQKHTIKHINKTRRSQHLHTQLTVAHFGILQKPHHTPTLSRLFTKANTAPHTLGLFKAAQCTEWHGPTEEICNFVTATRRKKPTSIQPETDNDERKIQSVEWYTKDHCFQINMCTQDARHSRIVVNQRCTFPPMFLGFGGTLFFHTLLSCCFFLLLFLLVWLFAVVSFLGSFCTRLSVPSLYGLY